ncbi:MAG: IS4 family transposase [Acidobacteriota bacterium]|nr:IS4 family transposase [Acidobacteriota bacterium]
MTHHSIVFAQLLKLLPRHEFQTAAQRHHLGRKLRSISRWNQVLALMVTQLAGRVSLRDLVSNFNAQSRKLYHLGARRIARSSLARVNERQPAELFEEIFHQLLSRTQTVAPGHRFRFKKRLISLDASIINLTASVFPWAIYQAKKGAIKLHVGLDHEGHLPAFVSITEGRQHEIHWARALNLPAGSVVVFDRGFFDYELFNRLNQKGIRFVTRMKRDVPFQVIQRKKVCRAKGLTSDQIIRLKGANAERYGLQLRRVRYRDPETGKHYVFLTNDLDLAASTIAQVYRDRWQIELFFKWIKQNLKIKSFLGRPRNAILSQIWVALIAYLLLAYLKFLGRTGWSLSQLLRLLQLNLFERRSLAGLLKPPDQPPDRQSAQLTLEIGA